MPALVSLEQLEIRLTDCLTALESKLRSCANAGYTDVNKRSEVIARDILNILLETSYELEPRVNSPGFDLRDSDGMSLVQITSKHTIGKVTECLRTTTERVAREPDLCGYELKILFLTTDSKTTEKLKSDTGKKLPKLGLDLSCIEFDPDKNLLDFNDLLRHVRENHVTQDQMARLSELMDKYWPYVAEQPAVDRVQEIIKQYADNFTAPLFMHRDSKTVTLQNMYVEPRFYDPGDLTLQFRTVTDYIRDFLWNKSREKIMVIEGDAAIGKTSLVSWMCYHTQAKDEAAQWLFRDSPVVCVRLRELEFEENEESADPILRYLNIPDAREFAKRYPDPILILDGADELGMVSSLNASRIGQFILNSCNSLAIRKLIVTSRPQILDISHLKTILFDTRRITLAPFSRRKREQWIYKYLALGETVSVETLNYIDSLTDQEADGVANTPLALYLLVQCEFQEDFRNNLWALYREIFSKAIMQTYYNSPILGTTPVLNQEEAKLNYAMVKEIAYTMFRNSGYDRFHITRQELDECARAVGLEGADAERVKQTCVLCAYWKNSTDGALEFYHNNIRDFFLCEYVCDQILEVVREMPDDLGNQETANYPHQGFPHEECTDPRWTPLVKLCCQIFSWVIISDSSWKNVFRMIALRLTSEACDIIGSSSLYAHFLQTPELIQFPNALLSNNAMWAISSINSYDHPYATAKIVTANAVSLWHILLHVIHPNLYDSNYKFRYSFEANTVLRDWHELFEQRIYISPLYRASPFTQSSISLFSRSSLYNIDWDHLFIQNADFTGSALGCISSNDAIIRGAYFSSCTMDDVSFYMTQLQGCFFKDSLSRECNFRFSEFDACTFSCSDFDDSCFEYSELTSTQITNAKFIKCDFNHAQIEKTVFENALFFECSFSMTESRNIGAEFRNVKLDNCTFKDCTFNGATAQNCTYRNVDPETAAQLEAIGFTEDTTERIFDL